MILITAIVTILISCEDVRQALSDIGVKGITVTEVKGIGNN